MAKRIAQVDLGTIKPPRDWTLEDGITQSLLSSYLCCPFRGLLKFNRWCHDSKRANTRFGSAFHEMLDKAYSKKKAPTDKALMSELEAYLTSSSDYTTKELEQREEDKAVLHAVLRNYYRHYARDFKDKNFKRVEKSYDVEWNGWRLRGKIDGEYLDGKGRVRLMEHKTKSRIDEDTMMQKLAFDFQNLMYITMYEAETGKKVYGTLYNVIRRPGLHRKAAETLKQFADRVAEDVAARPEHHFKRIEIMYSAKDKALFKQELNEILNDLEFRLDVGVEKFYRNRFACDLPFKCEFLEACASGHLGGYTQQESLFPEL